MRSILKRLGSDDMGTRMAFLALAVFLLLVAFVYLYDRYLTGPSLRTVVARARTDLHTTGMALDYYFRDHGSFPNDLTDLTTPVCYQTQLPHDPFRPARNPLPLISYRRSRSEALIYSWGPDRKDDRGEVEYDPTNGARSRGDIVRRVSALR